MLPTEPPSPPGSVLPTTGQQFRAVAFAHPNHWAQSPGRFSWALEVRPIGPAPHTALGQQLRDKAGYSKGVTSPSPSSSPSTGKPTPTGAGQWVGLVSPQGQRDSLCTRLQEHVPEKEAWAVRLEGGRQKEECTF